ncbi:hypothetical protein NE237_004890 [Protea cynaroides]|uniref:Uncharacterized protein n=1 Tax=Protea cynaroides TaxID=273540 RepID=A0A9Q0KK86_9MAGN|nr:hypothetical protein NE237_004890 [Protea cynaroides]
MANLLWELFSLDGRSGLGALLNEPGWQIWFGSSSQRTRRRLGDSGPLLNANGMLPSEQRGCLGDSPSWNSLENVLGGVIGIDHPQALGRRLPTQKHNYKKLRLVRGSEEHTILGDVDDGENNRLLCRSRGVDSCRRGRLDHWFWLNGRMDLYRGIQRVRLCRGVLLRRRQSSFVSLTKQQR